MKNILSLLLVLTMISPYSDAQKLSDSLVQLNSKELSNYYKSKAKKQKVAGLILLGGGAALALTGMGMAMSNMHFSFSFYGSPEPAPTSSSAGMGLFITGGAAILGSIPLFIASANNKREAKLLLGNQPTALTPTFRLNQRAIGLAIPLGR